MDRLSAVLSRFASTMLGETSVQAMLDAASREAVDLLPVDGVGIVLLATADAPEYLAGSDAVALRFERLQSSLDQGPCVIARDTMTSYALADLASGVDFPDFVAAAQALGLAGAFAIPMRAGADCVGVLDLYRMSPGSLTDDEMHAASTVADVLAAYVSNAQSRLARESTISRERRAAEDLVAPTEAHDFVATLVHELGSPLASLAGFTWLLENAPDDLSDLQRRLVAGIHRNSDELGTLAADLLTLFSLDPGASREVHVELDVRVVLAAACDRVMSAATPPDVELVIHVPETPVVTRGAAPHLERMLANLVSNAVKYTPPGGTITCLVTEQEGQVVLEVRDTGIGIPADEVGHLFTRFFRASNAKALGITGTGFGLAIVKSVVQSHDGTIAVSSALGAGTRVRIRLPAVGSTTGPGDPGEPPEPVIVSST
ncbi:GAF domain-containing sensor histidine kinase [Nocardioides caricicola]|uniref:histidine kinase n=1 Tax=Nocardioides caricicola TaxID=634770 RepID=A0ABW0N528_9ACTN